MTVRVLLQTWPIIQISISQTVAISLKPVFAGWAVCLSDRHELARFRGPGARFRAVWYLAHATRA